MHDVQQPISTSNIATFMFNIASALSVLISLLAIIPTVTVDQEAQGLNLASKYNIYLVRDAIQFTVCVCLRESDSLMEAVGRCHMEVGDCPVWGWRQRHPHVHFHSSNLQETHPHTVRSIHTHTSSVFVVSCTFYILAQCCFLMGTNYTFPYFLSFIKIR